MIRPFNWLWKFVSAAWNAVSAGRRFVGNIVFLIAIAALAWWFFGSKGAVLPTQAVLVLAPTGTLVEQRTESLFSNEMLGEDAVAETLLNDVIAALDHARDDSRIKAVYLDLSKLYRAGFSKLQDVGSALKRFRESGKPVISSSDFYTQRHYYLAAHADRVYLNPMGGVLLTGFGIYRNYYKSALDKLLMKVHVFRAGSYKSAMEPFMRDDMSAQEREVNAALLNVLWSAYKSDVAAQRGIDPAMIDDYINHFPSRLAAVDGDSAKLALGYRLVDGLKTRDEVRAELVQLAGSDSSGRGYNQVRFEEYLRAVQAEETGADKPEQKVGVIVAQGVILDGTQPAGKIGGDSMSSLIRRAASDDDLRALVVRIDSPGGSAFASEAIRRELELVRLSGKPVVVSMGSTAASGGYWIASVADEIWAAPTTLTGSIGIFGAFPSFDKSLEAIGIRNDGLGTTRMSDAFNPSRPMNELLGKAMEHIIEQGYRAFIARVAEGRRMEPEKVEKIAQGRVWSGQHAQTIGLVDRLGELREAVESAARKAGLDRYDVDYLEQPLTRRERLLKELSDLVRVLAHRLLTAAAPQAAEWLRSIDRESALDTLQLSDPKGAYAYCISCVGF
jgi:protease-4